MSRAHVKCRSTEVKLHSCIRFRTLSHTFKCLLGCLGLQMGDITEISEYQHVENSSLHEKQILRSFHTCSSHFPGIKLQVEQAGGAFLAAKWEKVLLK